MGVNRWNFVKSKTDSRLEKKRKKLKPKIRTNSRKRSKIIDLITSQKTIYLIMNQ